MQMFIEISNPQGLSSRLPMRKARELESRGKGRILPDGKFHFGAAIEFAVTRMVHQPADVVRGSFKWYVGWSGCARVMMAQHEHA